MAKPGKTKDADAQIASLLSSLADTGPMRPGSLSRQFRNPKERKTPFWQLSYTMGGKSRSEYVKTADVPRIRAEIAEYRRFMRKIARIAALCVRVSRQRRS
jgi:hypothetical protein